ncbi:MAG: DUF1338 domain-containing protein [Planctomycetaceae bacterium]|nr:DUF1338 domain-containing protein [Planctomycetaceae bacterium]
MMKREIHEPHQAIEASNDRERFTLTLFDRLWEQYHRRVSYVQVYEQIVRESGATFVNDHIAFRTFANQTPTTGIVSLSRIFEALDYRAAAVYHFPDKHLNAIHYQHPHPEFPKLFISELKTWEVSDEARQLVSNTLTSHREPLATSLLSELSRIDDDRTTSRRLDDLIDYFQQLPWQVPEREAVEALNRESQYAAWVLVHGYNVNHFTSLVNSHGVDSLNDLKKTISALSEAGVPLKRDIEGEPGSKLRQSATEAVTIDVDVTINGKHGTMPWTYAYFELAERNLIVDPATGKQTRFEGFLGPQATNLFEMTKVMQ